MQTPIITVKVQSDQGLIALRERCRQIADVFGLDGLQRTRLTTAASEIGRNALQFAGGASASFFIRSPDQPAAAQSLLLEIVDKGRGVPASAWANGRVPNDAKGGGLRGSQRLVDGFTLKTSPAAGTCIGLEMHLPRMRQPLSGPAIGERVQQLLHRQARSPVDELEQQNHDMLETLEALRTRQVALEEADLRKNEFVAMLAHELRNPLAAISMTLTLLNKRKGNVEAGDLDRFHGAIGRHTEQLTKLVSDLMDASRVSRGTVVLNPETVDLRTVVDDAVEMTGSFVQAKQHHLRVSMPDVPLWVHVDVVRMKQVVSNLVHNAARYTDPGGTIEVTVRRDDDTGASVVVADNGIGIDVDMLPKIFDLFTQAAQELARRDTGLGVGLTIVQRLVQEHGGTVRACSDGLGRGSRFEVGLPLVDAPAERAAAAAAPAEATRRRHVLIVDDNADMAHAVADTLRLSGFVCATTYDGRSAIAMALADRPDAVLVDIGLPLVDGFDVARTLRAQLGADVLLLAISGYSSPADTTKATHAGFDGLFAKPVDFEAVLARLHAVS